MAKPNFVARVKTNDAKLAYRVTDAAGWGPAKYEAESEQDKNAVMQFLRSEYDQTEVRNIRATPKSGGAWLVEWDEVDDLNRGYGSLANY